MSEQQFHVNKSPDNASQGHEQGLDKGENEALLAGGYGLQGDYAAPPDPPVQRLTDKRLPLHLRQQAALNIGRTHGNQRLQRLLATPKPAEQVQRSFWGDDINTVEDIIASDDSDNINWDTINLVTTAPLPQRIQCIQMLHSNTWVGPDDEALLERIWDSMGVAGISANIDLFKKSVSYGVEIEEIGCISEYPKHFEADTKGITTGYLAANKELIYGKMLELGITEKAEMSGPGLNEEREKKIKEMQEAAQLVHDAMQAQKVLESVQVGWFNMQEVYREQMRYAGDPIEMRAMGMASMMGPKYMPAYYRGGQPEIAPRGDENPALFTYEQVDVHYQTCKSIIDGYSKRYPGLYQLAADGKLQELAEKESPLEAQAMIGESLRTLMGNIDKTIAAVPDDLDYQELHPIHAQLKGGLRGGTGTDWSSELGKFVIEQEVEGYEDKEFWISLGLGTLGAAAFVVAELATFGSATFLIAAGVGVGAGATQAGRSIEKYDDLATAAKATVSEDTRLVADGQVTGALISAVLDTVFAFIDVASPLMRGIRAGFKGAKTAMDVMPVNTAIKEIGEASEKELLQKLPTAMASGDLKMLEEGINKFGIQKVSETAQKSPKELLEYFEKNAPNSPMLERLRFYAKEVPLSADEIAMYSKDLKKLSEHLATGKLKPDLADKVVALMIEQEGPMSVLKKAGGWRELTHPLGKNSNSGKMMEAWRASLVKDLDEFMVKNFEGKVVKTGTPGHMSDLDTSQMGRTGAGGVSGLEAAAHREAAVSFLAGRVGVKPQELNALLDTDLFIDPRRIHMYDEVFARIPELRKKAAQKAASFEQELIYTHRYKNAMKQGNKQLAEQIQKEMSDLGIKLAENMPELTPEMIVLLNREIDGLTGQLEKAVLAKDLAQQEKLVLEIANKQAMINAAEKGGYFSGGGTRALVSERDAFPGANPMNDPNPSRFGGPDAGYNPFKDPRTGDIIGETVGKEMDKSQMFTAAVDQLLKLDKSAGELALKGAEGVNNLPTALKDIGKYGQRFAEIMQRANMVAAPNVATQLDKLALDFMNVLHGAKGLPVEAAARETALKELTKKAESALAQLNSSHLALLQKLQAEAGLHGVSGMADALKSCSRAHLYYMLAQDRALSLIYQLLKPGVQSSTKSAAGGVDEEE